LLCDDRFGLRRDFCRLIGSDLAVLTDDGGMRGRLLAWAGGAVAVAAAVGLGVYFAVAGLGKADQLGSVVGIFTGLAGLVVSVYGVVQGRREGPSSCPAAAKGQSVAGSTVTGGITQVRGVTGSVRIGGPPSSSAAPPAAAPSVPSPAPGLAPPGAPEPVFEAPGRGDGQSVTDSQVGGDVTQVDGAGGDVDVDR
jgi:hypothetical protein